MAAYEAKRAEEATDEAPDAEILEAPLHDTGNIWYTVGSFFLTVIGAIGASIFRHFRYMRNWRACKKGAIIGFATLGAIVALFGVCLLFAAL